MINYFYDGTFHGYLSTIFQIYFQKKEPTQILKERDSDGILGEYIFIETIEKEVKRVKKGIEEKLGSRSFYELKLLFLSEIKEFEMIGYRFLKVCFKNPLEKENLGNIDIKNFKIIVRRVLNERHKMLGFVRFEKVEDGFFFSQINPDFNQLPIIAEEFIERLRDEKFIIYDKKRGLSFFYENGVTFLTYASIDQEIKIDKEECAIRDLWKLFFKKIAIKERKNILLQNSKIPAKYRDNILEFKEN